MAPVSWNDVSTARVGTPFLAAGGSAHEGPVHHATRNPAERVGLEQYALVLPRQRVPGRRIDCTQRLLLTGTMPVAEILRGGSFRDASDFAPAFHQRVGPTPSESRESRH